MLLHLSPLRNQLKIEILSFLLSITSNNISREKIKINYCTWLNLYSLCAINKLIEFGFNTYNTQVKKLAHKRKGGGGPRGKSDLPDHLRQILTFRQNFLPSCMCWVISNNLLISTSRIRGCLVFTRTANSAEKSSTDNLAINIHLTMRIGVPR